MSEKKTLKLVETKRLGEIDINEYFRKLLIVALNEREGLN